MELNLVQVPQGYGLFSELFSFWKMSLSSQIFPKFDLYVKSADGSARIFYSRHELYATSGILFEFLLFIKSVNEALDNFAFYKL